MISEFIHFAKTNCRSDTTHKLSSAKPASVSAAGLSWSRDDMKGRPRLLVTKHDKTITAIQSMHMLS